MEENKLGGSNKFDYRKIIKFLKTPRGRAVIFFAFYLFFFIFIFSLLGGTEKNDNKPLSLIEKITHAMVKIEGNNYQFKYTITDHLHNYVYEGKKYDIKEQFKGYADELVTDYQSKDNVYFKKINDNYIRIDSPFYPSELFDIKELKRLIKNSKLYSKTEYENNEYAYTYQLSVKDLINLLENEEIDDSEEIVYLTIILKDDLIKKIEIDATKYYEYLKEEITNYKITLEYNGYGKVTDLILAEVVE